MREIYINRDKVRDDALTGLGHDARNLALFETYFEAWIAKVGAMCAKIGFDVIVTNTGPSGMRDNGPETPERNREIIAALGSVWEAELTKGD